MTATEILAQQIKWCSRNMAHNLDFIPEDKLDWKPAPEANSALEVMYHTARAVAHLTSLIDGSTPAELNPLGTKDDAKDAVRSAVETYVAKIASLTPEQLGSTVSGTPLGDIVMAQLINMPVVDAIHHHGQLAYIQTILGDTESHFVSF